MRIRAAGGLTGESACPTLVSKELRRVEQALPPANRPRWLHPPLDHAPLRRPCGRLRTRAALRARQLLGRRKTSSNIFSVSLPVEVFAGSGDRSSTGSAAPRRCGIGVMANTKAERLEIRPRVLSRSR